MRDSEEELSSDGELEAAHAIPDQKADADAAELEVDLDFQKHLEESLREGADAIGLVEDPAAPIAPAGGDDAAPE
eukprot:4815912-Pyramimonas_sp.AAC.1